LAICAFISFVLKQKKRNKEKFKAYNKIATKFLQNLVRPSDLRTCSELLGLPKNFASIWFHFLEGHFCTKMFLLMINILLSLIHFIAANLSFC